MLEAYSRGCFMFQIGIGVSQCDDAALAAKEACHLALKDGQLKKVDWIVTFFSFHHINRAIEIWKTLQKETNCEQIAGCSGVGVLSQNIEIWGNFGLVVMLVSSPDLSTLPFLKRQESTYSESISTQLKACVESFSNDSPLVLIFPDAYRQTPYNLINAFNYMTNKPKVFGCGACDDGALRKASQIGPKGVANDGVSGICIGNSAKFEVGVTQSCSPINEPMFITEVKDNMIVSLDNQPALELYSNIAAGLGLSSIEKASQKLLLGFPLDRETPEFEGETYLARNLTGIDVSSNAIIVPQIVEDGGVISFVYRNAITAHEDLKQMLFRLKEKNSEIPSFGFYFNCAGRGENLYHESDVDIITIREIIGDFPLIGVFGGFELATIPSGIQLYSYTGVLILVY